MNTIKQISAQEKSEVLVKIEIYPTPIPKEVKAIISEQNPTTAGELIDRQVNIDVPAIKSQMDEVLTRSNGQTITAWDIVKLFGKLVSAQAFEVDSANVIGEIID